MDVALWLIKSAVGLYFLPVPFTMQAMGKARDVGRCRRVKKKDFLRNLKEVPYCRGSGIINPS